MLAGKLRVIGVIVAVLQSLVFAGWESAAAFDFDGNGVIGLGDFAIFASHWGEIDPALQIEPDITWVQINDPGIGEDEGFNGQMSKYETTNAQYCQFLNAAIITGDVVIEDGFIKGANGFNDGSDFADEYYYQIDGSGLTYYEAINGGASRISYSNGMFTVQVGFENHPVTYVSWYGAVAFCNYYGWRLPTELEWRSVADYDGTYTYGCGLYISTLIANCRGNAHPNGTTEVGTFGEFGYGMADMSGNVWEWTTTIYSTASYNKLCGGSWSSDAGSCAVSGFEWSYKTSFNYVMGFRVCR